MLAPGRDHSGRGQFERVRDAPTHDFAPPQGAFRWRGKVTFAASVSARQRCRLGNGADVTAALPCGAGRCAVALAHQLKVVGIEPECVGHFVLDRKELERVVRHPCHGRGAKVHVPEDGAVILVPATRVGVGRGGRR